tara:strand:+ start:126 stop:698 length:573 start_codon:yes stop_codon:yes gene_type:complete
MNLGWSGLTKGMEGMIDTLGNVDDPQSIYAQMARDDYDRYIQDFRDFEEQLLAARNDTSLIDRAREDAVTQRRIAKETQKRNLERYGGAGLSPAQLQEQNRSLQRGANLASVGSINNSRLAQREINQATLADLINIGQGINRNALGQMNEAAQMQSARYNAYKNAKASHSANMIGFGGQLGSALLTAFMI